MFEVSKISYPGKVHYRNYDKPVRELSQRVLMIVTLSFALMVCTQSIYAESRKPNIVFILIDDLGWNDVGYNGSTFYETPELDQLAREFMRFDRCYTPSPMCSPTRTSIMTGKNPARHGITQWLPGLGKWPGHKLHEQVVLCPAPKVQGISKDELTLGEALQAAGYETGFFGKWHMGKLAETGGPKAHGFDAEVAVIEENSCAMFYPFRNHPEYFPDAEEGDNFTDLLTESAIEFIGEQRENPFFVYLAHFAMHAPIKSKEEELSYFTEKRKQLPILSEKEGEVFDDYAHKPYKKRQDEPEYAGELKNLDENIGKIIQSLKDKGLYDNTIIIITGDNGGRTAFFHGPPTSVQPLRAGKTFTFDGGLRTPLLVHWPGVTKPDMQTDKMVTSTDFYPTLLEMTGLPQKPEQHMDGVSLVPLLKGKDINRKSLYFHFPHYQGEGSYPTSAICKGNYKLIVNYHQQDMLLYDIYNDIGETTNLVESKPGLAEKMKKELMTYLESAGAVIPQPNPDYKSPKK